jgi:hypothetical protein
MLPENTGQEEQPMDPAADRPSRSSTGNMPTTTSDHETATSSMGPCELEPDVEAPPRPAKKLRGGWDPRLLPSDAGCSLQECLKPILEVNALEQRLHSIRSDLQCTLANTRACMPRIQRHVQNAILTVDYAIEQAEFNQNVLQDIFRQKLV